MQVPSSHTRPTITFTEMKTFLTVGWGPVGARVADLWVAYNRQYFRNALEPLPIILVHTSPYGRWLGVTHCNCAERRAHMIQLTRPASHTALVADRGVLLHEMLHQYLTEQGDSPKHEHQPWCDGIMRLHQQITGERIWACPESIIKERDPDTGKRKSRRVQATDPETGTAALPRGAIATWPHSVGLSLGDL